MFFKHESSSSISFESSSPLTLFESETFSDSSLEWIEIPRNHIRGIEALLDLRHPCIARSIGFVLPSPTNNNLSGREVD
jgi:hypothetical protein